MPINPIHGADDDPVAIADGATKGPAARRWKWGEVRVPAVTLQPVVGTPGPANEVAAFYAVVASRVERRPRSSSSAAAAASQGGGDGSEQERRRTVERRFGSFDALDAQVRRWTAPLCPPIQPMAHAAGLPLSFLSLWHGQQIRGFFLGHHLASSLPALPPKHLKARLHI